MGLDNGMLIRAKTEKAREVIKFVFFNNSEKQMERYGSRDVDENLKETGPVRYEIAYWRKCWGIRHDIIEILRENDGADIFDYPVQVEQIPQIINVLIRFLSQYYYNNYAESIWLWHEQLPNLAEIIANLKKFTFYLKDSVLEDWEEEYRNSEYQLSSDEFEITFYDSF